MKQFFIAAAAAALALSPCTGRAQTGSPRDLLNAGDFAGARTALARITAGDPKAGLHRLFLEGLILIHQSKPREAADMFRKILAVAPNYEPARRELSATLYVIGDTSAAKFHAEQLVALTTDDRIRATAQAIVNASQSGKPSGVALRFAILPSSNITKGTAADEVIIGGLPFKVDKASKAASGGAVALGATFWRRWQLGERWTATASLGLDAKAYSGAAPIELTFGPRLDFTYSMAGTRFSIGPAAEIKRQAGTTQRVRLGLNAAYHKALAKDKALDLSVMAMQQRYPGQSHRDGWIVNGRLGVSQIVSSSLQLYVGVPFEVEKTNRPHLDHRNLGLTVGLDKMWQGGLYTGISASVERARYGGTYPGFTFARRDTLRKLSLSLRHSKLRLGRFTPELTYSFTQSASNVKFFETKSHDLSIALSSNF